MIAKSGEIVLTMDDIEMIVCTANNCGYMECAGLVYVDDDRELAEACIDIINEFDYASDQAFVNGTTLPNFNRFMETVLKARFSPMCEE